ncbi:MAG: L,D-transpeptidase [Jatrophihabitantaceae bacterium]
MTKPSLSPRPRPIWIITVVFAVAAAVLAGCTTGSSTKPGPTSSVTSGGTTSDTSPDPSTSTSTKPKPVQPTGAPVHIRTANADGAQYGVGMPIIAYFSKKITDGRPLQAATKVTVNGAPVKGAWYFEYSAAQKGYPIEGHWRPEFYWKAHSRVHVDLPMQGKSAGTGLVYDDNLTLDFSIGASHISTVDNSTHTMTVVSDGRTYGTFPVSLGASNTPTLRGIKVIMEKGKDIRMKGPGYDDPHVKYTQRLTYGGEYLHSAPWNCVGSAGCVGPQNNIGHANSSNGCTNLRPVDAQKLYGYLEIGDVVRELNADGPRMQLGQGYGDWNVPWAQWQTGGLVRTT